MVKGNLQAKKDARSHIVNALKLVHYMDDVKYGDFPEQQEKYEKEITKAKKELRQVYSPDNVIFQELDLDTHIGLSASLGALGLGDEPFIDMKRPPPEGFGGETFNAETFADDTFAGEMKNLVLDYVETIHPEDEDQQNQLMDLILSGEYEVPLDEMQMVVEQPSLAQPHMREMALASESFEAEEGRQYDLGILNVDRFWTQFVGEKRKSRRKKFKCNYEHHKRECACEAENNLRNSPTFTELQKKWGYDGAMILTSLPLLYEVNKREGKTRDTERPRDIFQSNWTANVGTGGRRSNSFIGNSIRTPVRNQTYSAAVRGVHMPLSLDWVMDISQVEAQGRVISNVVANTKSEKILSDQSKSKGDVKEKYDAWQNERNKTMGKAVYIENNTYPDYLWKKGRIDYNFYPHTNHQQEHGYAIKGTKNEYLVGAVARDMYLALTINKKSPKYRITEQECREMTFQEKTHRYKIVKHKWNEDAKTYSIQYPIHKDFTNLNQVLQFLSARLKVLKEMPSLRRTNKKGDPLCFIYGFWSWTDTRKKYIDFPHWVLPHSGSAQEVWTVQDILDMLTNEELKAESFEAESFSATPSNNHTSLARSQNHMGA